jgi:hypothetical protein
MYRPDDCRPFKGVALAERAVRQIHEDAGVDEPGSRRAIPVLIELLVSSNPDVGDWLRLGSST